MPKYRERAKTFREPTYPYPIRLPRHIIEDLRNIAQKKHRTLGGQVAAWVDAERQMMAATEGDSRHDTSK